MKAFLFVIVLAIGLFFTIGVVIDVDCENDTVVVLLRTGHMYAFYGAEGWRRDDFALLAMNNMHSEDVTDDQIVRTWKLGF